MVKQMEGYEILVISHDMTPEQEAEWHRKCKQSCFDQIQKYKDHPKKEHIWYLLTSCGDKELIYGPCPV
jgi:hypothetical protein